MRCLHCQSELKRDKTIFTESRNGYVIMLQDILAWVCKQCGESMFDSDTVSGIQDVLQAIDERVSKLRGVA